MVKSIVYSCPSSHLWWQFDNETLSCVAHHHTNMWRRVAQLIVSSGSYQWIPLASMSLRGVTVILHTHARGFNAQLAKYFRRVIDQIIKLRQSSAPSNVSFAPGSLCQFPLLTCILYMKFQVCFRKQNYFVKSEGKIVFCFRFGCFSA